ncbi:MAG: hypothetical protein AB1351_07285 [Thermoproteota archaeon]
MDNFEKIELIVKGKIKERKIELERSKEKHNQMYVLGLEHEVTALTRIALKIDAIK